MLGWEGRGGALLGAALSDPGTLSEPPCRDQPLPPQGGASEKLS